MGLKESGDGGRDAASLGGVAGGLVDDERAVEREGHEKGEHVRVRRGTEACEMQTGWSGGELDAQSGFCLSSLRGARPPCFPV